MKSSDLGAIAFLHLHRFQWETFEMNSEGWMEASYQDSPELHAAFQDYMTEQGPFPARHFIRLYRNLMSQASEQRRMHVPPRPPRKGVHDHAQTPPSR